MILSTEGIGWQRPGTDEPRWRGSDEAYWLPWRSVGGLSDRVIGKGRLITDIYGLDGAVIGSIDGAFEVDGGVTRLPHVVALFRADLFVEVEGSWTTQAGCIRREVAEAEGSGDESSQA